MGDSARTQGGSAPATPGCAHSSQRSPVADVRGRTFRFENRDYLALSFRLVERARLDVLTPSERAVALAIAAGSSNADIARARSRSVNTVANQVASVFRKLGVQSRLELCRVLSAHAVLSKRAAEPSGSIDVTAMRFVAGRVLATDHTPDAAERFEELCRAEWQVVDCYDVGDRRYLFARRVESDDRLSPRQHEALIRRSRGAALKEIAIDLGVSVSTISRELSAAMKAIGAKSHADLPRLLAMAA